MLRGNFKPLLLKNLTFWLLENRTQFRIIKAFSNFSIMIFRIFQRVKAGRILNFLLLFEKKCLNFFIFENFRFSKFFHINVNKKFFRSVIKILPALIFCIGLLNISLKFQDDTLRIDWVLFFWRHKSWKNQNPEKIAFKVKIAFWPNYFYRNSHSIHLKLIFHGQWCIV